MPVFGDLYFRTVHKDTALTEWTIEILDWNNIDWVWYEKSPYSSTINLIKD